VKKVLIALCIFVLVLAAAILVIPSFIDWSGHRAEIAKKIKEATGRELIIGGDIAFTVIPSPVLKIGDIHLANATNASSTDMIAVEQLDVRVSLLPLLAGNIHVQSIRLIRPVIQLEVLENGKGNWLFATDNTNVGDIETTKQSNDPAFIENDTSNSSSLPIQIDNLIIEQGQLVYLDKANDIREDVRDINSRFAIAGLNGPFEAEGTMLVRGIPLGIEGSIGQIIHGRTASFATQVRFAHGNTSTRFTGTLVNLAEGPKISAKLDLKGDSLAGFINAFQKTDEMAGGLNRSFSARGEMTYGPNGLSLGKDGLALMVGEDRGTLHVEYEKKESKQLSVKANFSKIDGDAWLNASPYQVIEPTPLAPVITLSTKQSQQGSRISAAIGSVQTPARKSSVKAPAAPNIPTDLNATVAINIDALLFKEQAIRQAQANISLTQGEIALERLSAILPGAGELTVLGVAGERAGKLGFDGTLDLNVAHLRGALDWLDIDTSHVPLERLQQVTLKSDINFTGEELHLLNMETKLDGSTLNGGLTIALQSRPSFGASFHLDQLNLDAYLPAQGTTHTPTKNQDNADQTGAAKEPSVQSSAAPVLQSLKLLNTFDANLDLSAGQVVYRKQTIEDIQIKATVFDGKLDIQDAHIKQLAGVRLAAKGGIAPSEDGYHANNLFLSLDTSDFTNAATLIGLQDALDWSRLGTGNASITLNGPVLSPDMDINVTALDTTLFAAAKADLLPLPKAEASINLAISDFTKLTQGLGVSYRPRGPLTKLDISADLNADLTQTNLKNIVAQIGEDQVSGHILFKQQGRPHLNVNLQTDHLNVTPFLPNDPQATSKTPTSNTSQPSSQTAPPSNRWSKDVIDFGFMQNMDADLQLNAKRLLYKKVVLDNLVLTGQLKDAELNISDASANLFGGQAKIVSKIVTGETNDIQATLDASGLKLKPLLSQTGSTTVADGTLALKTMLVTQGKSENDFVSNLNGNGSLNLNQVSVSGKNTGGSLFDILNLLATLSGKDPAKGLADIAVQSDITKGVAKLSQASLTSPIAGGSAQGQLDLPKWYMDVSGTLNIKQNALIGLLAQKAKMKQDYPFALKGPLDAPNVKLDTGSLSSGGGLIIPLPDKLEKKGYGNLIRGLIGASGGQTQNTQPEETTTPTTLPAPQSDGETLAPPPPPGAANDNTQSLSPEQQLLQGLGNLLRKK